MIKSNFSIILRIVEYKSVARHQIHSHNEINYLETLLKKPYNSVRPIDYYFIKFKRQAERKAVKGVPYSSSRLTV